LVVVLTLKEEKQQDEADLQFGILFYKDYKS